jgi:hypothetical protein
MVKMICVMRKSILTAFVPFAFVYPAFCWGFYAHKLINRYAVFLLPPEMMVLYKPNLDFITIHAVDPTKEDTRSRKKRPATI